MVSETVLEFEVPPKKKYQNDWLENSPFSIGNRSSFIVDVPASHVGFQGRKTNAGVES